MVTQIVPAASLRSTNRLPAGRTLLQAANYLICWALWPIRQAIFRVELVFSLLSGRARDITQPGRQSETGDQPGDGVRRRILGPGCSHQEDALAGGLGVEEAIGFLRLVQFPLVGEEAVDIDLAVDDKLRAVGLALPGEGPRGDDRQLLAQHVGADVDRHIVALADKTYRAPHLGAAHRGDAALGLARSVEGEVGAAMGQV